MRGDGEWRLRSVRHTLSLPLLPPHSLPLLQRGVSPSGDSSPRSSPTWVLPMRCSPSGTGCSSMGPPQGHKPCQQTCSRVGSSFHGATGPARSLLQCKLPKGSQPASGILLCGYSLSCRWISAPPWVSMGCRGTACLTMVFITGCRGISALVPGAPPSPPPSSLTLVSAELFLSHCLLSLSCCKMPLCRFFFFLNYVFPEVLPPSLMAWPLPVVGPSWSRLALSLSDIGEISSRFSQKPPV